MTDIEIAKSVNLKKIKKIAKKLKYKNDIINYGQYKAKLPIVYGKKNGKVILVTAINPTKLGIGKTTVAIGLADAIKKLGKKVCLALREPSLGPVFGIKGGATGGGYSQIAPMEDINLHFNGDFHAITSANNLLCSMIDNHIYQGNQLDIDVNKILFHRCLDLNDRALRQVTVAQGAKNGVERQDQFTITAASEIMAIMCLCRDFEDLKIRLGNIMVALNSKGRPIYARDLHAEEGMAILLKDAIMPNLVQTLEHTPALVHMGPFANIAHGCNSIIATKMAQSYADYVVTEAGFGADLGAEKFFDVKCRVGNIKPSAVVLVVTVGALKLNGGASFAGLSSPNVDAVKLGMENLYAHINTIFNEFKLPMVVAINKYKTDTFEELSTIQTELDKANIPSIVCDVYGKDKIGTDNLAKSVINICDKYIDNNFKFLYDQQSTIKKKIKEVATRVYGAKGVKYSDEANKEIEYLTSHHLDKLPIVIAKTQYSLSDNAKLLNRPKDFYITITDIQVKTGAGFIVAIAGNMLLMPGLSKTPNVVNMHIDEQYNIEGLF